MLARSPRFVSVLRSRFLSYSLRSFLPCFTNHRFSMHSLSLTLCHGHSFPFVRLSLLARAYSSSGVLRPNGEIAVPYPSLSLVYHPPPGTITELSRSVYYRCCPPLPPPTFPPTIALSPSDSVSLHLSTIFVLSLPCPFDLSSPSFSRCDPSVPPIERSTNSTTYRQIKFVLVRRARHI